MATVRKATLHDIQDIYGMLLRFNSECMVPELQVEGCHSTITRVLTHLISGSGFVLVAQEDTQLVGMFIAAKISNTWDPRWVSMNELVYWVDPEHRNKLCGAKMLKWYIKHCDSMLAENKIKTYTVGRMSDNKAIDYGRWGFRQIEEKWIRIT